MSSSLTTWLTPPRIAELLGLDVHQIHGFIKRGELVAVDLSQRRNRRPRYRISPMALEAFLRSRQVEPPSPRARRKAREADCPQYV
jgi:hypothetical protein